MGEVVNLTHPTPTVGDPDDDQPITGEEIGQLLLLVQALDESHTRAETLHYMNLIRDAVRLWPPG